MAYSSGTATDQNDLLDRLKTFLTGVGPGWTALKDTVVAASPADGANRYILFDAPGGGSDNIYTGIELNMRLNTRDALQSYYKPFFRIQGYSGHDAGLGFDTQPTAIPTANNVPTFAVEFDRPLPYHFIANGRRCIIAVQSGRFWSTAYMGWYLPFATPAQLNAEPLLIAGSNYTGQAGSTTAKDQPHADKHICYQMGLHDTDTGSNIQHKEGLNWVGMARRTWPFYDNNVNGSETSDNKYFWRDPEYDSWDYNSGDTTQAMLNLDGTPPLIPVHLIGDESGGDIFGVYDGVYAVGGDRFVLQDDIVSVGGVDHLLIEAIPYSRASMIALKLE